MTLAYSASFSSADTDISIGTNADRAYDIIRERLIMLDIRPGEPINDDRLAGELGFGRTPVGGRSSVSNATGW